MSNIVDIKNSHLFLASSADVDAIIHPLKTHFGVTSVVYQRNFNDGSEIRLSNQPAWVKHFYEQGYYRNSGFEKHPQHYQSGFVVWAHLSHHQPILEAARRFNIDHGLTLIQKTANGCEFYFIGTTPDKPHVANLLLNNIEFLKRFTLYFKEQASLLLKNADSNRIIIPKKYENIYCRELGIPYKNSPLVKPVLKIKKIYLDNNVTLSSREIACAKLLVLGKTAHAIAEQLYISPRTVETHLQHLKEKLHCRSKSELISKLIELNV